jgi:hypothetical protein
MLISLVHNGMMGALYMLRLFQYSVVGFMLAIIMTSNYKKRFICLMIISQLIFIVPQAFNLIPNFDPSRGWLHQEFLFSGSYGTPAELSYLVVSFIGLYYTNLGFFSRSTIGLLISFNSVLFAPLAIIALGFKKIICFFNQRILLLSSYLLILLIMTYLLGLDLFIELIQRPVDEGITLKKGGVIPSEIPIRGTFQSLLMRVNKFLAVGEYMRSNPLVLLFGCGYGCGKGAIDSGLVRLLLEFGVVGFIFLFIYIKKIPVIPLAAIIAVNFFFDGLWSSAVAPIILSYLFLNFPLSKLNVYTK